MVENEPGDRANFLKAYNYSGIGSLNESFHLV